MSRKTLLAILLVIAAGITGILGGPRLWTLLTTTTVWEVRPYYSSPLEGPVLGYLRHSRGADDGEKPEEAHWYLETGFRVTRRGTLEDGREFFTEFDRDGRILSQYGDTWLSVGKRVGDVQVQTEPSAPWLDLGLTPAEFWERVKPPDQPSLEQIHQVWVEDGYLTSEPPR